MTIRVSSHAKMLFGIFMISLGNAVSAYCFDPVCNPKFSEKTCLIDTQPTDWSSYILSSSCNSNESIVHRVTTELENIFTAFPATFQRILCKLDRFYLLNAKGGSAFSGFVPDSKGIF